jgi:hypothetical protein
MTALGYLVQGLTMGMVGLTFDKGFVLDEDTPLGTATLQPYTNVSAAAVAKYDKAIAAASGASWTIPPEFTGGLNLSADRFARMANTLAARQLAYTPRNATENAAVNWAKVLGYAEKGISTGASPFALTVEGDGGNIWYDLQKYYGESQSWMRVDQRVVQLMDPSQPVVYTSVTRLLALSLPICALAPRAIPALISSTCRRFRSRLHAACTSSVSGST